MVNVVVEKGGVGGDSEGNTYLCTEQAIKYF